MKEAMTGKTAAGWAFYPVFLALFVTVFGMVTLFKGGLYVDRHEGDVLHLAEILLRMDRGEVPHIDFLTPLGVMAFLPISWLMDLGYGVGTAILLGQIGMAMAVLPAIWWAGSTRFGLWPAYAFAITVLVMILALVHGEDGAHVSLSMYYNRWAWALSFIAIVLALLPSKGRGSQSVDGVIIGAIAAFLLLSKVTYAVGFGPAILAALLLRGQMRALICAVSVVIIAAIAIMFYAGLGFWPAYVGDLLQVSRSDIRPNVGLSWADLALSPRFIMGNAVLVAAIVFLRRSGAANLGLFLMLLAPGFLFVTYQNFGNDPKWLALLALLLLPVLNHHRALAFLSLIAAALIAPSFANMTASPLRHLKAPVMGYTGSFEAAPHNDFHTPTARVFTVHLQQRVTFESDAFAWMNDLAEPDTPAVWQGEELPTCLQQTGLVGTMKAIGRDLDASGLSAGKTVFTADTFGALWLFSDLEPLPGGAPWYYGGLSGYAQADYLLIPTCPGSPRAMRAALKELDGEAGKWTRIRETELFWLYARKS